MWSPTGGPNEFIRRGALRHSQGDWEEHKYVKKVDDKYYYPNSYDKGRTISDLGETEKKDPNRSERKKYSKDDSDFDEKNYSDKNLLGNTEFYGFKNKDGRNVILMEDKKWTLPEGAKLDSKLTKRLEAVSKEIVERRERGEKITADEWNKLVDDAIDGITDSKKKKSSKKSGSSKKESSKSSGKSKQQSDRERKAKNKATMKKRTEEQIKNKQRRMARNKMEGKEYLNHSFWAPTDYLMHHGVDGQKWGVKNGPPYPLDRGHKTSGKRKYRTDKGYHKDKSNQNKPVNKMSNDELQRRIDRKQLEKTYADLNDQQSGRSRQKAMNIVRDYATVAAAILTTAKLIETGRKILKGR